MKWKRPYSKIAFQTRKGDSDDWSVSLADMTLLVLTFFVVLVSVSSLNARKYREVAEAMSSAMRSERSKAETTSMKDIKESLEIMIREQNLQGEVAVNAASGGFDIVLAGGILFDSGSASFKPEARAILEKVASQLKMLSYPISVEGHTDNVPIKSPIYPSNWELSAARASEVLRFFIERNIPESRLRAVGLADTRPVAPNGGPNGEPLPQNQAKNRRVVIVVTHGSET